MRLICDTAASCACKIGRSASPRRRARGREQRLPLVEITYANVELGRGERGAPNYLSVASGWSHKSSGSLPALRAISRFLNILRAGNGRYATVRSSSSPFSSSVRNSRLSSLCPSTVPCHRKRVVFEDVRAGIVATLRRHRNDDRDELSAHEWLYQERRVHHDVSIEDYGDPCRSHWAGFGKFTKWMHDTHTL